MKLLKSRTYIGMFVFDREPGKSEYSPSTLAFSRSADLDCYDSLKDDIVDVDLIVYPDGTPRLQILKQNDDTCGFNTDTIIDASVNGREVTVTTENGTIWYLRNKNTTPLRDFEEHATTTFNKTCDFNWKNKLAVIVEYYHDLAAKREQALAKSGICLCDEFYDMQVYKLVDFVYLASAAEVDSISLSNNNVMSFEYEGIKFTCVGTEEQYKKLFGENNIAIVKK